MGQPQMDLVAQYGLSKGWKLLTKIILVEGTSDVAIFELASQLYEESTGKSLLSGLAIIAAGHGDRGGTSGVVRELIGLRNMASTLLSPTGAPLYRVVGLFDNDAAGVKAVNGAKIVDTSISEYRDVFRLRPVMPKGSLDPKALQRSFEQLDNNWRGLPWELEDLIGQPLIELFLTEYPTAMTSFKEISGFIHREFTRDGKSNLVSFCKAHADLDSLSSVVEILHSLRHYMNLPKLI